MLQGPALGRFKRSFQMCCPIVWGATSRKGLLFAPGGHNPAIIATKEFLECLNLKAW